MSTLSKLTVGKAYSKKQLAELLEEESVARIQTGISRFRMEATFLFVNLVKEGIKDDLHYEDHFEEDGFHWDSQNTQHFDTPMIQNMVTGRLPAHLFARMRSKVNNQPEPYIYCGKLEYVSHDPNTSNPVHILFRNTDYQHGTSNPNLTRLYSYKLRSKPPHYGITITDFEPAVVEDIDSNDGYIAPNETERRGLVTTRVGQGEYRKKLLAKWNYRCPVTGYVDKRKAGQNILIASHIIPWADSNDSQRLDPDNGILLSPCADALFDRHLISFNEKGRIILSPGFDLENLKKLGISGKESITVTPEMEKYLRIHRSKTRGKND